ncbi:MAG: hypothetical protein ACYCO0_03740, partial [Candidatus Micrarchaeaceae archaeon]
RKEVEQNVLDLKSVGIYTEHVSYGNGAFVEGGDILALESEHLVVVGISGTNNVRTNKAGVDVLAEVLRRIDPEVTVVAVPHTGVLHLETGMTPLVSGLALKDPKCSIAWDNAYYPIKGSQKITMPPWEIIELPESEGYSAHVLPVNGGVIIADGYPTVKQLAQVEYKLKLVIAVPTDNLHIMDGSPRCLTVLHNENPK